MSHAAPAVQHEMASLLGSVLGMQPGAGGSRGPLVPAPLDTDLLLGPLPGILDEAGHLARALTFDVEETDKARPL
jgi:hypothetical protein